MRAMKLTFLTLFFLMGLSSAFAQNTRVRAKPLATPPPTLSGAEIISRAIDDSTAPIVTRPDGRPADQTETNSATELKELRDRIKLLEGVGKRNESDEKQKRLMLNLDILTRAEQRSESLRKQHFEMIEKENTISARLEQIEVDMRPEMINRALQLGGSLRPEEIREARRKSLMAERTNLQSLLVDIQTNKTSLQINLQKSEQMVEKLRLKLEKEIDDSILKDDQPES